MEVPGPHNSQLLDHLISQKARLSIGPLKILILTIKSLKLQHLIYSVLLALNGKTLLIKNFIYLFVFN